MDTNVIILAAGLGTRMKSKKAKVLHRAGGMTLVEHVVQSALAVSSPERIVVVVGHQAEQVRAALAHTGRSLSRFRPSSWAPATPCPSAGRSWSRSVRTRPGSLRGLSAAARGDVPGN